MISARFLSVEERIEVADLHREGVSVRQIAQRLNRAPSTVSRELRRNAHIRRRTTTGHGPRNGVRCVVAPARSQERSPATLLREAIDTGLRRRWSPEQISKRPRRQFPDRPEMHVTHETIYQALYVQGRGELRRELARCLRTGRAVRKPQRRPDQRRPGFQAPMIMISERPAEVEDRAVPGHWESQCFCQAAEASARRGGSW